MPTHGSLTKAGKMREQTGKPKYRKVMKAKVEMRYSHMKAHKSPSQSARRRYEKRVLLGQKTGQNYPGD